MAWPSAIGVRIFFPFEPKKIAEVTMRGEAELCNLNILFFTIFHLFVPMIRRVTSNSG